MTLAEIYKQEGRKEAIRVVEEKLRQKGLLSKKIAKILNTPEISTNGK